MATQFYYEGLVAQGGKTSGELKARSRAEALRDLQQRGVRPTQLVEKKGKLKKEKSSDGKKATTSTQKSSSQIANGGAVTLKKKDVI